MVNQVEWAYNGLGQPTAEYQAHGGSVNQATTPRVQTAYAHPGPTALAALARRRAAITPSPRAGEGGSRSEPGEGAPHTASYQDDGLHRRITSGTGTSQRHYYSASWQVLEERIGTNPDAAPPERQFVWGLRYLDDCVLRDRSPTNNGVLSERLYALQDANWNVTSLISPAGAVQERYRYAAYGQPTFLSAAFVPLAPNVSAFDWETLYCGYRYDRSTGLYQVRYRYLHPGLGCWLTRDPIRYRAGDLSLLRYVLSSPLRFIDPLGLRVIHVARNTPNGKTQPAPPRDVEYFDTLLNELAEDEISIVGCLARWARSSSFVLVVEWIPGHEPAGQVKYDSSGKPIGGTLYLPSGDPDQDFVIPPNTRARGYFPVANDPRTNRRVALILIAHELGHAVAGLDDPVQGTPKGGNLTVVENPFRGVLGVNPRLRYFPGEPDPPTLQELEPSSLKWIDFARRRFPPDRIQGLDAVQEVERSFKPSNALQPLPFQVPTVTPLP